MNKAVLIMDRHRFDADLDPVFHFDAVPKKSGSYLAFSHVGESFSSLVSA